MKELDSNVHARVESLDVTVVIEFNVESIS